MMFEVCRSLALDKAKFAFTGFLACYWFHIVNWEEAITEKRIAILIEEITKIRTSLLFIQEKRKKNKDGRDWQPRLFFLFFLFSERKSTYLMFKIFSQNYTSNLHLFLNLIN